MTLFARTAALEGPDRAVDAEVAVAIGEYLADPLRYPGMFAHKDTPKQWGCGVPRFTASLDAAMSVFLEKPDMVPSCPIRCLSAALIERGL